MWKTKTGGARLFGVLCGVAILAFAVDPALPKIYVEPQNGFESYISAAIIKKQVPVVVTQKKEDARYLLTSAVLEHKESTGGKIARCAFLYCIGIAGTQTATVQLIDPTNQDVVWAYNVRKADASAYQSTAEAIAKHLKEFLKTKPKLPKNNRP